MKLRGQLAIVSLTLAALPLAGYQYVREMERFLLEGQEQSLLAAARAVATALHDRPQLMQLRAPLDSELRRQAEDELRRLAAERGDVVPAAPAPDAAVPAPPGTPSAAPPATTPPSSSPPAPLSPDRALLSQLPPLAPAASADPARAPEDGGSVEIEAILRGLQRSTGRIWVVNSDWRVLALAGSLKPAAEGAAQDAGGWLARWLQPPADAYDGSRPEDILDNVRTAGREVASALSGKAAVRVRNGPDGKPLVASAAHPIWAGERVAGAVVAEEGMQAILAARARALGQLALATLAAFIVAALTLVGFASVIARRIRRLRDEAERAIDTQGRVAGLITPSEARDEIGDLSRSFHAMLERLAQHNTYLEELASRLSHELRTPVAVVRSSLENLRLARSPEEARPYLARAEEGLARLSTILGRMSEATRLEASLQSAERERFDLAAVARGCVEGYRLAYPGREFVFRQDAEPAAGESAEPPRAFMVEGSPDLVAQMLDKLVANASDFATEGTAIELAITPVARAAPSGGLAEGLKAGLAAPPPEIARVELSVTNRGPRLPEGMKGRLFDSMVSVRAKGGAEPHLGMGLYIARLVAEHHGGTIRAEDLASGEGVRVVVTLPLV